MPTKRMLLVGCLAAGALCWAASPASAKDWTTTIVTDADSYGEADYYTSSPTYEQANHGAETEMRLGIVSWNRKAYMHFDMSQLAYPARPVSDARLQIEWKETPYDAGGVSIFAIMDEANDWDLAALPETGAGSISYANAPQCGPYDQREFSDEASDASAITRYLDDITHPGVSDPNPEAPIDIDVTGLIQWAAGQNAAYSNFTETGNDLTVCMRETAEWQFIDYYSKEYTPLDDNDAPRLVITQSAIDGDANLDGCVDGLDYVAWSNNYDQSNMQWEDGDYNADGTADGLDYVVWSNNYNVGCPGSPAAVPEPSSALVLILGCCALRRRR